MDVELSAQTLQLFHSAIDGTTTKEAVLTSNTRLYLDLGIYGDDFDELYEDAAKVFGTRPLFPAENCPDEFPKLGFLGYLGHNLPITRRLFHRVAEAMTNLPDVTLREFESAFLTGKFIKLGETDEPRMVHSRTSVKRTGQSIERESSDG